MFLLSLILVLAADVGLSFEPDATDCFLSSLRPFFGSIFLVSFIVSLRFLIIMGILVPTNPLIFIYIRICIHSSIIFTDLNQFTIFSVFPEEKRLLYLPSKKLLVLRSLPLFLSLQPKTNSMSVRCENAVFYIHHQDH